MSHFGWLGSPVQPITTLKVVGVLVMIGGVALATTDNERPRAGAA